MTPHYPDLSPQRVLFKLNEKLLTPNPSDKRYVEIRDYMNMGEIGRGGQGTCFYAMDRKKERMFAYKMTNNEEDTSKLLSECKILSELCHEHVVLFLGAVDEVVDGKVRMFMELAECGTIEQQFKDNPDFQVDTIFIAHLFEQVLQGVNYLHQKCILHRDIKGENILLFEDSRCKLTDFGLAVHADNISKDNCVKGTCPFVSPEYVRSQVYTYSCDVWSTMTVAVEMLTGKSPWHHTNNNAHMMFMIGNYSAGSHFNKLVPERELERQLREAFPSDENLAPVMYYYQGILAMMKSVFHEDTTRRPSAYDLLRTEVMRRAPDVYDEASDSDYSQLLTSQPEHGQCDVVPRSCHGMGRETAYSSVQQPIAHFKNSKSWPMNCAEYRDYLDSGRRLSCITRRCGSAKGEFRRALSYQHQCGGETQSYVRRHSLAETYVMKGPDTDSEFKKVLQ
jgi:serine/threonine protein kinase